MSNAVISGGTTGVRVAAVPSDYPGAPLYDYPDPSNNYVQGDVLLNLSGGSISGATTGIDVEGQSSGTYTATANLLGGTSITSCSTGILVHDAGGTAIANVSGSTISGNTTGIDVEGGSATATYNTLANDTTGIKVDGGTLIADNNLISGGSGDSVDVTAAGTPSVSLFGNALTNSGLGVSNANSATVNAGGNWWGVNTDTGVAGQTSGSVVYNPWLDTSANSAVGTGFSGDFSKLDVGNPGTQESLVAGGLIDAAIGDLTSGGTIKVYPGTYSESVDITEPLTLESVDGSGSTMISDPPAPTATVAVGLGVSRETISGFTITASSADWALYIDGTDATIENNVFRARTSATSSWPTIPIRLPATRSIRPRPPAGPVSSSSRTAARSRIASTAKFRRCWP